MAEDKGLQTPRPARRMRLSWGGGLTMAASVGARSFGQSRQPCALDRVLEAVREGEATDPHPENAGESRIPLPKMTRRNRGAAEQRGARWGE
jgi:hypothetical protein